MAEAERSPRFSDRVFEVVRQIPHGSVASYGLVARLAGSPRAARHVGMVMRHGASLPWWRVLGQDGRVRIVQPEMRREQVERLLAEGIEVDAEGRVDYERHRWRPQALDDQDDDQEGADDADAPPSALSRSRGARSSVTKS